MLLQWSRKIKMHYKTAVDIQSAQNGFDSSTRVICMGTGSREVNKSFGQKRPFRFVIIQNNYLECSIISTTPLK